MTKLSDSPTNSIPAQDFTLTNVQGEDISLSDYEGEKHVVLVFNRGFT